MSGKTIVTTTPLMDNKEYAVFHDWLWAFNNFAFRHPAHHEVPGILPFDNISNAPTCIITYALMLDDIYNDIDVDIAIMHDNPRVLATYADGGTDTFKGKVLFKYKRSYEKVNGEGTFSADKVPMVPFIGNFMPMPCDSEAFEALRNRVSHSDKTNGLFAGYLAHVAEFVSFSGADTKRNYEGKYVAYELTKDMVDEQMRELLTGNEDIKRYFSLFRSYDDFIEKNFLQDFFFENNEHGNALMLVHFFDNGYDKNSYNEFATVSREIINDRGARIVTFLMNADKKMRS